MFAKSAMPSAAAGSAVESTEQQIRERLEKTGEFSKMRAMIVEAALQSLARDQPDDAKEKLFYPSEVLVAAKGSAEGRQALAAIHTYLSQLGLQYTASVLALETGLPSNELQTATSMSPTEVASTVAAATAAAVGGAGPPVSVPVPFVGGSKPTAVPSPSSATSSEAGSDSAKDADCGADPSTEEEEGTDKEEEEEGDEEPPQPGAEDSTYYISKWKRKTFVRVNQVVGQQVQVEYLTDCTVVVLDPLDSMTVDDCEGGQLIIAACEGSVFLRNCKNMTVHVACKQLRTRDCEGVDLHIFTTTDPVVEMSHHMTFRPFHLRLPNLRKSFKDARLDPACNRFVHVYDFTVDEPSLPQPHFTVTYPDPSVTMEDRFDAYGAPECPPEIPDLLTGKLLPAASSESGQNKSYDIKTGSAAWAAAAATVTSTDPMRPGTSSEDGSEEDDEVESATSEASEHGAPVAAIPVPSAGSRPPVAPAVSTANANPAATGLGGPRLGGLDDEEYSSFDESSESVNEDDKYEVEEDDDDF